MDDLPIKITYLFECTYMIKQNSRAHAHIYMRFFQPVSSLSLYFCLSHVHSLPISFTVLKYQINEVIRILNYLNIIFLFFYHFFTCKILCKSNANGYNMACYGTFTSCPISIFFSLCCLLLFFTFRECVCVCVSLVFVVDAPE